MRLCLRCAQAPRRTTHPNTRYCTACREALLHHPASRVTEAQAAQVRALRGTMVRHQLAAHVGISGPQLTRFLREQGLTSNNRDYPAEVVAAVARAYEAAPPHQGRAVVAQQFPGVVLRSIVERRAHHRPHAQPRQVRWTGAQLCEAARMAGLVSPTAQARFFGRPNAFGGSIKALWVKRFQCASHDLNGLAAHTAWALCGPGTSVLLVRYQLTGGPRAMCLWLTLAQQLRPDVPAWIGEAVAVLAHFQAWLHGTTDATAIATMVHERETAWR